MELTPELLGTGVVGLIVVIGAVGRYLSSLRAPPPPQGPVLTGIGLGWSDREQTERMFAMIERIAKALETIADKRTSEMENMHRTLLARLDAQRRSEEQEEQEPRSPRRR